jgi:23S rRNA pseudouridine2457 synthase
MVKAVNHPCKRLIRISIEGLLLGDMKPGEIRELKEADFFKKLKIDYPVSFRQAQ